MRTWLYALGALAAWTTWQRWRATARPERVTVPSGRTYDVLRHRVPPLPLEAEQYEVSYLAVGLTPAERSRAREELVAWAAPLARGAGCRAIALTEVTRYRATLLFRWSSGLGLTYVEQPDGSWRVVGEGTAP